MYNVTHNTHTHAQHTHTRTHAHARTHCVFCFVLLNVIRVYIL